MGFIASNIKISRNNSRPIDAEQIVERLILDEGKFDFKNFSVGDSENYEVLLCEEDGDGATFEIVVPQNELGITRPLTNIRATVWERSVTHEFTLVAGATTYAKTIVDDELDVSTARFGSGAGTLTAVYMCSAKSEGTQDAKVVTLRSYPTLEESDKVAYGLALGAASSTDTSFEIGAKHTMVHVEFVSGGTDDSYIQAVTDDWEDGGANLYAAASK